MNCTERRRISNDQAYTILKAIDVYNDQAYTILKAIDVYIIVLQLSKSTISLDHGHVTCVVILGGCLRLHESIIPLISALVRCML